MFKDPAKRKAYHKVYHRQHYEANKQLYIDRAKAQTAHLFEVAQEAKRKPCADCHHEYAPWIMEFDHVRGKKVMNVAKLVQFGSLKKLLEEIAKCEVVCSNCHAERTHNRKHQGEASVNGSTLLFQS